MIKKHFSLIDFHEAVFLIGLGLVDFDETYPHVTKNIETWAAEWRSSIHTRRVKAVKNTLVVNLPDNAKEYTISFDLLRVDLLPYIEIFVNLKHPRTLDEVIECLNHLISENRYNVT